MTTIITTYESSIAEKAHRAINKRRVKLGFSESNIRSFQKSIADGKGDVFHITYKDGQPVDVVREFDPIF